MQNGPVNNSVCCLRYVGDVCLVYYVVCWGVGGRLIKYFDVLVVV